MQAPRFAIAGVLEVLLLVLAWRAGGWLTSSAGERLLWMARRIYLPHPYPPQPQPQPQPPALATPNQAPSENKKFGEFLTEDRTMTQFMSVRSVHPGDSTSTHARAARASL